MLPIIPNSKKGTSTRKKRPRILPSASAAASSKKKKSSIIKQPTSKASASLKDDTTTTLAQDDATAQKQHEPITLNTNSNVNEEEDTLLLAAEAAAALMDEIPNSLSATNNTTANNNGTGGEGNSGTGGTGSGGLDYADIPMNLLDEVNTSVEYAASMMTKEQQLQKDSSDKKEGVKEKEAADKEGGLKVPYLPPIQYNNNIETMSTTNPLGNEVISFTSKLPEQQNESTSTMSTVQKNFLNHYYYNGLNDGSGDKSVLLNGNSSSLKRVGGKDTGEEEEEIVEEEDGTTNKQKKGKENVTKDGEEPSLPNEEEEGKGEVVALTLRTVCASIPRTIKKKNKKNKNLKLKNEGENDNLIAEEEAAAMGSTADKEIDTTTAGQEKDTADEAQAPTTAEEAAATEETPETATGPQVKVNEQGEIVIEQESLLPNPETRQSTAQIDQELGNTVIDEGETPSQLGAIQARYDSYTSQPRQVPVRWSVTETKSFYRALRQCGTDFSMMEMFLVGRTRSQLKRKFKIESRKNARLIDMALNPRQKVKLDLSVFGDNLVIPTEVPAIKILPPVEDTTTLGRAAASKDTDVNNPSGSEKRKSVEKSFDHLFEEEEKDGDDTAVADGDKIDESIQKGKNDEQVPAQATTVVPPVIAAAKSNTSKTKAKKAFKPKVKKPKKMIKKAVSVKK